MTDDPGEEFIFDDEDDPNDFTDYDREGGTDGR